MNPIIEQIERTCSEASQLRCGLKLEPQGDHWRYQWYGRSVATINTPHKAIALWMACAEYNLTF